MFPWCFSGEVRVGEAVFLWNKMIFFGGGYDCSYCFLIVYL